MIGKREKDKKRRGICRGEKRRARVGDTRFRVADDEQRNEIKGENEERYPRRAGAAAVKLLKKRARGHACRRERHDSRRLRFGRRRESFRRGFGAVFEFVFVAERAERAEHFERADKRKQPDKRVEAQIGHINF